MAQTDLHESLRQIVSEQLQDALAPHQALLEQIAAFLGIGGATGSRTTRVARAVPAARTARATATRARRGSTGRGRGRAASTSSASFKEGQEVRYRQGRGEFEATVIKIDEDAVTVERKTDGKKVTRPADKLYAA